MNMKPTLIALSLLLAGITYAQSSPPAANFKANLLIAESNAEIEKWVRATPAERAASGRKRTLEIDTKYLLPAVVTGYTPDSKQILFTADYEMLGPGGKVYFQKTEFSSAQAYDPRSPSVIVLNPVLNLTFDKNDTPGKYIIRITVNDHLKGTVSLAEEQVTLVLSN
jgi:hypothetical protein